MTDDLREYVVYLSEWLRSPPNDRALLRPFAPYPAKVELAHSGSAVYVMLRTQAGVVDSALTSRREVDALIAELRRRADETFGT